MKEKDSQRSVAIVVAIQFLLVSITLCCMGISGLMNGFTLKSYEDSNPREYLVGTVISYQKGNVRSRSHTTNNGSSSTSLYPVYEYFYEGESYQYTSPMGSSNQMTKTPVGSIVTLVIFAGDTTTLREDGFFMELRFYYGGVLFLLGGLVFAMVGIVLAIAIQSLFREQTDFSPYQKLTLLEKVRTSEDQVYFLIGSMFFSIGILFAVAGLFLGDDHVFFGFFTGVGLIVAILGGRFLYHFFKIL